MVENWLLFALKGRIEWKFDGIYYELVKFGINFPLFKWNRRMLCGQLKGSQKPDDV